MSQYFLRLYLPVADALLNAHGLDVPESIRAVLATEISKNRELPAPEPVTPGSRSATPHLRKMRTHAKKLIEYSGRPPTRRSSVDGHWAKLNGALQGNELLVGLSLVMAGLNQEVLDAVSAREATEVMLQQLVDTIDKLESESAGGIGRPRSSHSSIIWAGCTAWERAGRSIDDCHWKITDESLTGGLPDFLRDLVGCCDGSHQLVRAMNRIIRVPEGFSNPFPSPKKGDALRGRIRDLTLRDGIRAWVKWCNANQTKN